MEQKRTRRTFDPSFKHHAAQRVVEGKEKAAAVAADLGDRKSTRLNSSHPK